MHPLGHITFGCGAVWAGAQLLEARRDGDATLGRRLIEAVDFRLVAFGALLPDIVDKPLGKFALRDLFDDNGHVIGHTLLFALLLLLPGILLATRGQGAWLLCIGLGDLSHLLVDPVAHAPETLFWPLLGSDFPHVTLLGPRATIATESTAALILLGIALTIYRRSRMLAFLRSGRL